MGKKTRLSQKATRLLNLLFILRLLACVRACISNEESRWGQISASESLLHATTVRLRSNESRWVPRTPPITPPLAAGGESGAGRQGRYNLSFHAFTAGKSQENTSVVLWRSFSSHTCGFSGVLEGISSGAGDRRKAVLSRSNVGTLRRGEKHSVNGSELVSLSCSSWITVC